jgi:hypothetical protein
METANGKRFASEFDSAFLDAAAAATKKKMENYVEKFQKKFLEQPAEVRKIVFKNVMSSINRLWIAQSNILLC